MRNSLYLCCLFLVSLTGFGQSNLDSLHAVWQDENQSDSVRVLAYKAYIYDGFLFSDPPSAAALAEELYAFGENESFPFAMAKGADIKGISFYVQGNYVDALKFFTQSVIINEQIGNKSGVAKACNNIGSIYLRKGIYQQALIYLKKSLEIKEELGDEAGLAGSLGNIGIIYSNQGNYPRAVEYYNRSLELHQKAQNQEGMATTLANLGMLYKEQGDTEKALAHMYESLELNLILDKQDAISVLYGNIGVVYMDQSQLDTAVYYVQRSLKISEELGDKLNVARDLATMGRIHIYKEDLKKAEEFCLKGYEMASELEALEPIETQCECLYDVYKKMGDGASALIYLEKKQEIQEALTEQGTAKQLAEMEFANRVRQDSIQNAEHARLIEEAHQEEVKRKNQSRNIFGALGILAALIALGFFFRWRFVQRSREVLQVEKDRSENLLLNILPEEIAQELKEKGKAEARDFDQVSILFTDFKDFTEQSEKLSPTELVSEINHCFEAFDRIMEQYGIEKIKTIGDAYMAAGGLPVPTPDSVPNTVLAGLDMQRFIEQRKQQNTAAGKPAFEMRVGIHTGPVVAGIVGVKKFQYDIWGDTVNTASRMESNGVPGKVNVSQSTFEKLKDHKEFTFESRGKVAAKGKGEINMYFVSKATS